MVALAWLRWYRPSQGFAENNAELAADPEKPDTMVAIFTPIPFMARLEWREKGIGHGSNCI